MNVTMSVGQVCCAQAGLKVHLPHDQIFSSRYIELVSATARRHYATHAVAKDGGKIEGHFLLNSSPDVFEGRIAARCVYIRPHPHHGIAAGRMLR